jgi:DNA primase
MPKSSFIDFKAVKAAITMEQVLAHYGFTDKFKRSGDSLSGPCPIHGGSNPTQFRISISKNIWNCFSECKHGGNVLDFIARMEDVSIHAAALKAVEWFRIDLDSLNGSSTEEEDNEAEAPKKSGSPKHRPASKKTAADTEKVTPNKPLKFRLDKLDPEHPYLRERGLSRETVKIFGIGFCEKGMMEGRIAIPISNPEGAVVAYAGRFPGEPAEDIAKYKLPQGFRKSLEVFNIERAIKEPEDKPLVMVEGFFGCISVYQHGHRKVVGLMGSTMSPAQEELIRKHVSPRSQVILALDEDEAGQAAREDIANRLVRYCFIRIQTFKKPGTQPEDLSAEEVQKLIGGTL